MKRKRFDFILEARQPIAHHEETFGNTAIFMSRKVRQPDGSWARVPTISADAMRHGLREASTYALLDAAGLLSNGAEFTAAALRLLFAGGMVTGSSGGAIKLDDYHKMVDLLPPLALFGGCAQNRIIPGRLTVDDAILICTEQAHLLPDWVHDYLQTIGARVDSCRAHVEEVQRVRMDPMLNPNKRRLLSAGERAAVEGKMIASESASGDDDAAGKAREKSSMMPRRFERLCAGSLFWWSVTAVCYSDLDIDTFHVTCAAFLSDARVGGKKGTGHGLLAPVTGRDIHVRRPADTMADLDPKKLGPRVGQLFGNHVRERAEQLQSFLCEVQS